MPSDPVASGLPSADPPRSVVVIANPAAGRGRAARRIPALEAALDRECSAIGATWQVLRTGAPRDGERLAARAAEGGASVVAAAGGDGTVSEVVNGLGGTSASMGLVPLGTGNDLARHLRLPCDIDEAVRVLLRGQPRRIDVGVVAGRRFLNVAGCGFDAQVAARVNRGRFLHGTAAYVAAVLQTLASFHASRLCLTVDGHRVATSAMLCAVANSSSYGGGMRVAPHATLCDGLLDICVVKEVGRVEFLRAFPRVFRGEHTTHPKVTMLLGAHVVVESDPPMPLLVDGEVIGSTPFDVEVEPAAMTFMTPAGGVL
jgi:diacylglycerol kinase (ATP)